MRFDPFLQDATLRRPFRLLNAGAWDELDTVLAEDGDGWPLPSILTSDDAAIETVIIARFAQARPSGRSLSLLGGVMVRDAFDARHHLGGEGFRAQLRRADEILDEAKRLDPDRADPWVHALASGRGQGVDVRELRHRFENAHARSPFRPDACCQYLLGLSSQAGGSDDAMFDFARWIQSEASSGTPAMVTLPMAHLEYGMSGASRPNLTEHLTHPATVAELTPALAEYIWETPSRAGPQELPTLNAFALAMTVNDRDSANLIRECFRRIDNRPTAYPWTLYEDEEIPAVFTEAQRVQLRSADQQLP